MALHVAGHVKQKGWRWLWLIKKTQAEKDRELGAAIRQVIEPVAEAGREAGRIVARGIPAGIFLADDLNIKGFAKDVSEFIAPVATPLRRALFEPVSDPKNPRCK